MSNLSKEFINEVQNNANIVDVIGATVELHKNGSTYFGNCPLQKEKTASLAVNPTKGKGIWKCFGCGASGNVFKFVQQATGMNFPEAVEYVANFAGVEMPKTNVKPKTHKQVLRENVIKMNEKAASLYHHVLVNTVLGEQALEYLHERNVSDEMIEKFNLGFVPSDSNVLAKMFASDGVSAKYCDLSGLFVTTKDGKLLDRFSDRIVFPIRNRNGKTVAFSGRLMKVSEHFPKYLNSPETEAFNRSNVLYNADLARFEANKAKEIVLVEGFMDVIASYSAGVKNVVSSLGTSLTEAQASAITKMSNRVVVAYDGDQAGQKATNRSIDLLEKNGKVELAVVKMPVGVDPADFVDKEGVSAFVEYLQSKRMTDVAFKLGFIYTQIDVKSNQGRLDFITSSLNVLAKVNQPVKRNVYLVKLADTVNADTKALQEQLRGIMRNTLTDEERHQREYKSTVKFLNSRATDAELASLKQLIELRLKK